MSGLSKDGEPIFHHLDKAMKFHGYLPILEYIGIHKLDKSKIEIKSMTYDDYYYYLCESMEKIMKSINIQYGEIDELAGEDYDYYLLGKYINELHALIKNTMNNID